MDEACQTLSREIHDLLCKTGETVSTAESCTGGNIAAVLTALSGSSQYFQGGIVVYTNACKVKYLNVSQATIDTYTVYSEEVVREMVQGACRSFGTTYAIAVSGIAGPTGALPGKPVGTIWLAVGTKEESVTYCCTEDHGRAQNIAHAVEKALEMFLDFVKSRQPSEIE